MTGAPGSRKRVGVKAAGDVARTRKASARAPVPVASRTRNAGARVPAPVASRTRYTFSAADAELARRDRVMAHLIERAGPFKLAKPTETHFEALLESIVFQQLAGKAASAIHKRVVEAVRGSVTPRSVLKAPDERLRAAGLSGAKLASIKDLAFKVHDGTVPLEAIEKMSDDDIIAHLCVIRGIGRWTAEMFLMFQLRRMDVWPVDDFGVRKGYAIAYGLAELPKPKELQELGERFRPIRTAAAWYCWRAVDLSRQGGMVLPGGGRG